VGVSDSDAAHRTGNDRRSRAGEDESVGEPARPRSGGELLEGLNPAQRAAVEHRGGPLVVIAGAGSGKTRVLTRRIAALIAEGVSPFEILAITFTNRAAGEMRDRVAALVGERAEKMWISTFHSACVRILRREADRIGYPRSFTIYDELDSRRLIETVLGELGLDTKRFAPRGVLAMISSAKSELQSPASLAELAFDEYGRQVSRAYDLYDRRLFAAGAMDFDDLLGRTVALMREHDEVAGYYGERFRHLLVDEFQDTNRAQNELVLTLGAFHRNVCVVGDTDQSIYRFRGADLTNLLDFERVFPDATVVLLEQNYRSTQTILDAANAIISHNAGRKDKTLWSARGTGEKIRVAETGDERGEATYVASEIADLVAGGAYRLAEIAVFYRTNAQSRVVEEALVDRGIAYKVIGGTRFYDRREVRDLLSYLRVLANPADEISFSRILNTPRRGIGDTSAAKLAALARSEGISLRAACARAADAGLSGKALVGAAELSALLDELSREPTPPGRLAEEILEATGYRRALRAEATIEAESRLENLAELIAVADSHPDLLSFVETTALVTASDDLSEAVDRVSLMTLHSAKGLEYRVVFLVGMEEELLPHSQRPGDVDDDGEEERRLCYVGITRARELLYLSYTCVRTIYGQTRDSRPSRFLAEIPEHLLEVVERGDPGSDAHRWGFDTNPRTSWGSRSYLAGESSVRPGSRPSRSAGGRSATEGTGGQGTGGQGGGGWGGGGWEPSRGRGTSDRPVTPVRSTGAESLGLQPGDRIVHSRWGEGTIVAVEGEGSDERATIRFARIGEKHFLLALTPLKRA